MNNRSSIFSQWQEVTSGERNEIVFERLNKTYGAYEIRTNYDRTLLKALSSGVLLVLMVSAFSFFSPSAPPFIDPPITTATQIDSILINPPGDPPVDPPVTPPGGGGDANTTPVIVDTVLTIDSTFTIPTNPNTPPGKSNDTIGTGTGTGPYIAPPVKPIDSTFIGDFLEVPPSFPGGEKALFGFLQKNTDYPERVKEVNGKGVVVVGFVLDKEGNVTDVTVLKATKYPELNNEAMRVIRKLPKWNPGKQGGQTVKASMIQPIRFELKQ